MLTREQCLKEAERYESEGNSRPCEVIVKTTVVIKLENKDRVDTGGRCGVW